MGKPLNRKRISSDRSLQREAADQAARHAAAMSFPADPGRKDSLLLLGLTVAILIGGCITFWPTVTAIFSPSSDERIIFTDDLNDQGKMLQQRATVSGAAGLTEYGVVTLPGQQYQIRLKGTNAPGELPFVRVWMYGGNVCTNTITFRSGSSEESVQIGGDQALSLLVYPKTLRAGASDHEVIITSSLSATATQPVMTLDRLEYGLRVFPAGECQFYFWAVLPCALVPWLVYFLAAALRQSRRAIMSSAISAVVLIVAGFVASAAWPCIGTAAIVLGVGTVLWMHWKGAVGGPDSSRLPVWIVTMACVSAALWMRWRWLIALKDQSLLADASTYMQLAQGMRWGYDTGQREPFFVWLVWLFSRLTAWGPLALRLLTVLVSLAEGVLLILLALEFMSIPWAVLVGMLYAFNPVLAQSAPLGLREEVLPCAAMLFLFACIRARERDNARWYHVLAVAGAVACVLTRLNALTLVVPAYTVFAWLGRWRPRTIMAAAAVFVIVVVPHFIHNQIVFGDFLRANNIYGTWWRNFEFAGRPGFITREEFNKNGNAGTQITLSDYLFKHHRPVDLTTATLHGFWKLTAGTAARDSLLRVSSTVQVNDFFVPTVPAGQARWFEWLLLGAFLIGIPASLRLRNGWCLVTTLFLLEMPVAFIWGWFPEMSARLAMNQAMIMLLLVGIGTAYLFDRTARSLRGDGNTPERTARE